MTDVRYIMDFSDCPVTDFDEVTAEVETMLRQGGEIVDVQIPTSNPYERIYVVRYDDGWDAHEFADDIEQEFGAWMINEAVRV